MTATSREDLCKFIIISRRIILGMRNVSDKIVEKIKTRDLCSATFSANRAVYEINQKNVPEPDRPQMAI